jgi:hypothetical protein
MDLSNYIFTHARGVVLGASVLRLIQKRLVFSKLRMKLEFWFRTEIQQFPVSKSDAEFEFGIAAFDGWRFSGVKQRDSHTA